VLSSPHLSLLLHLLLRPGLFLSLYLASSLSPPLRLRRSLLPPPPLVLRLLLRLSLPPPHLVLRLLRLSLPPLHLVLRLLLRLSPSLVPLLWSPQVLWACARMWWVPALLLRCLHQSLLLRPRCLAVQSKDLDCFTK